MRGWVRRHARLIAQIALLPPLYIGSVLDPVVFGVVVAAVLLVPPPICWTVFAILKWTSVQAPDVETLRERANDMLTLSLMASAGAAVAALALLSNLFGITVPGRAGLALLAWILLLIVVPAVSFIRTWHAHWLPLVVGSVRGVDRDEA